MNRRQFLKAALVPMLVPRQGLEPCGLADLKKYTINRVTGFRHVARRPHVAGKNAVKDVHGANASEDVIRIATDVGVEGIGVGTTSPDEARLLLGHSLDEYWRTGIGVLSPLGRSDHALYDLVGKATATPTWRILGGAGPDWVPVYDGSVYFNDLLPEHNGMVGVPRLLHEVAQSLKNGHRAFKIKVGRGFKWMDAEAGLRRDVEVVKAIRGLVGKDVKLMADANNAFDLETTERFLDAVGSELYFVEEMFPEQVDRNLLLKDYLKKRGFSALVADGESARDLDDFDVLIAHEALDVFQPDIRVFGLTRMCVLARKLAVRPRLKLAAHNWGSFLGLYMQAIVGRSVPNFLVAEHDPCTSDLFDASSYTFKDGRLRPPETPGCGLTLREDVYKARYAADAWTVS
jgi:L-alanine-DL-glutamate epimerase-like enolase superfamily enzyme